MTIQHAIRAIATTCSFALFAIALPNAFGQSPLFIGNGTDAANANAGEINPVQNGLFLQGQDTYRVVDTAGFRTAADLGQSQAGTIAQVGYGTGCSSCGTSSYGGDYGSSCSSCGSCGGGYGGGLADACTPCDPYCYVSFDALYMDHDGGRFSRSQDFQLGDLDRALGSRITIGSVSDCVHGYELSFVGPLEWDQTNSISLPGGGLRTNLRPGAGFNLLDLSSFADFSEFTPGLVIANPEINFISDFQSLSFEAKYWSLEANRTCHAGEYAKLLIGTRYISYDEQLVYSSRSPGIAARPAVPFQPANPIIGQPAVPAQPAVPGRPAGLGQLSSQTNNDLYGLQVGMDGLYPICCNGYTDFRLRAGLFIDSAENTFVLTNANAFVQAASDSKTELAGLIELGAGVRYQVGQILSIRAGTELWYLSGIAAAQSQFNNVIVPSSGSRIRVTEDVLLTGFSIGAELKY